MSIQNMYYFFLPSVSIPEGGLKIDENKLKLNIIIIIIYYYYYLYNTPDGSKQ